MATYDAEVLQEYADTLYQQAQRIVISLAFSYACRGLGFAIILLIVGYFLKPDLYTDGAGQVIFAVILTLVGVAAGVSQGKRKAFELKLEAQKLLCQKQIEQNTRKV